MAARGLSWTTSRAVACLFATIHSCSAGARPLVLVADIPKGAFVHHDNGRSEHELVCFDAANFQPTLDGHEGEWSLVGAEWSRATHASDLATLALASAA